ncbi:RNA polymerase sigma-70 factor [Dysgonomonas sp. Marseille-P4677]|uniref:RNA polymerase sigma-70 factor n=1 Tax=Dysgonomonas sp. Marseille-P4677 TaxID=2364790 RepID=UPI00191186C7|nr:RNA polymerase sigma-70 factor [Dysgonomonas sp. Marseille-P4677]MBK5722708.1 RNA polymerase sigma-70 factor [Dysgonomonas sp. Marseille-P4677]
MKSYSEKRDSQRFEDIYTQYFAKMKRFAKEYVLRDEDAENIVHDAFTYLWENWEFLSQHANLFAFLFLSVKNRSLDFLRRRIVNQKAMDKISEEYILNLKINCNALESFEQEYSQEDIENIIRQALDSLPEKCRDIFIKSKIEGKKQKDIATELNISLNTVESQMAIAYKKLRKELKNNLPLFLFLFL